MRTNCKEGLDALSELNSVEFRHSMTDIQYYLVSLRVDARGTDTLYRKSKMKEGKQRNDNYFVSLRIMETKE
jgi:hypothetical protein